MAPGGRRSADGEIAGRTRAAGATPLAPPASRWRSARDCRLTEDRVGRALEAANRPGLRGARPHASVLEEPLQRVPDEPAAQILLLR